MFVFWCQKQPQVNHKYYKNVVLHWCEEEQDWLWYENVNMFHLKYIFFSATILHIRGKYKIIGLIIFWLYIAPLP